MGVAYERKQQCRFSPKAAQRGWVGAQSTASSFPFSPHFFHLSLTYTDSCDKKSQSSLLNRNFSGVSSLRVSEKQLSCTKLCREEQRLPPQRPSAWQCGRVKGTGTSATPAVPEPWDLFVCQQKPRGIKAQKNCRNRHMVSAPGD